MDEVPLSFDIPPTRTVDVQGASSIPINTTGNERTEGHDQKSLIHLTLWLEHQFFYCSAEHQSDRQEDVNINSCSE
ncbi:hypothetical protein TNCV_1906541 [Trichonephila clavipes]|nr:hypothetical protein TNCV_1906541 [Trichonephila clavipes]